MGPPTLKSGPPTAWGPGQSALVAPPVGGPENHFKVIKQFVCVATHFLVMSPYSCDSLCHNCIFNYNGCYSSLTYERLVFR